MKPRAFSTTILTLFFLSGLSSLVYETVWVRMLRLVMGNTVFSVTTVLTVFMGGLALGSYGAGRLIDRMGNRHPLIVYGLIEGIIGGYALLSPLLIDALEPLFRLLYRATVSTPLLLGFLRFFACGLVLFPPTTLMGATLPVMSHFLVSSHEVSGQVVGRLYAVNTFGGAAGVVLTGFFLIPLIGVRPTLWIAVLLNFGIWGAACLLRRVSPLPTPSPHPSYRGTERRNGREERSKTGTFLSSSLPLFLSSSRSPVLLPLALALGGFASMVDEVVWTRLLSLAVGSSVYAFSLILAAFITGLGLGSLIVSRFVGRVEECLLLPLFYGAEIVIGLFSLAIIPVLGRFPVEIVALTTRFSQSFSLLQAVEFFLFFLLFLIPTLLMGIVFPVAVTLYRRTGDVGRSIGILYSANTVGALIGSFAGGFLLIPLLGLRGTIIAAATVNLVIAMLLRPPLRLSTGLQTTVVALALILLILLLPEWDRAILTSGAHLYGRAPAGDITEEDVRIVYYKEGVTAVVSVIREGNHLSLKINGKTDASSGSSREDMRTQILSAHLPLLLHTNPQSVLVVGLGSGITLGSVLRHPVETVECVEISPDVVEASRYFDAYSGAPLDDPRVRLIVGDGRNHITLTDRRYDVIISEPSNPWIAGMSDLFTVEYFEQCRRHLNPGGVMCQWLQAYRMSDRDIGSVVRTFRSVFPHVVLWESTAGIDYLLTGTFDRDPVIDARDVEARLTDDRIRSDLRRIRVATLPDLLAHWITADGGIDRIAGSASIHTDDNALLEFSTPKSLYRSLTAHDIGRFASHRVDIAPLLTNVSPVFLNRISTARQARETSLSGIAHQLSGRFVEAETAFRQAIAINPDDADAVYFLSKIQVARGRAHARQNRIDEAIRTYRETLSIDSSNAVAHRELGYLYELKGMDSLAVEEYRQAVTADPAYPNARNTLGNFYLKRGDHDEAERVYREAIAIDPWYVNAYNNLGSLYARRGEHEKAGDLFRRAIHLDPTFVSAYNNLGNLYLLKGDHEKAAEQWKRSLRLDPENLRAKEGLKHLRHLSDQKGR